MWSTESDPGCRSPISTVQMLEELDHRLHGLPLFLAGSFEPCHALLQIPIHDKDLLEPDERSDDEDARINGCPGIEHASSHDGSVLGEGEWQPPGILESFEVVAICDHLVSLAGMQLEKEIRGEFQAISANLLPEPASRHSVQLCKVTVYDDPASPDREDPGFDGIGRIVLHDDAHDRVMSASDMYRRREVGSFHSSGGQNSGVTARRGVTRDGRIRDREARRRTGERGACPGARTP